MATLVALPPPSAANDLAASTSATTPTTPGGSVFINPDKKTEEFRNFGDGPRQRFVQNHYHNMNTRQTMDFVAAKRAEYMGLTHGEMTVWEVIEWLDTFVDASDPDTDVPNSLHDFQTAERIRKDHPDKDWYHLVGLLHDLGKILAKFGEEQFCVVGDTFPVGCKFSPKIVFSEYFSENPDTNNEVYSSPNGIYEPGCGLDNLLMTWGHDEYMYHVLKGNGCPIPDEGLYCIRFHSFYPWHREGAYTQFETEKDREMKKWVLDFNKYDLYSKSDELPDVEALKPYYKSLVDKYCPGKLRW